MVPLPRKDDDDDQSKGRKDGESEEAIANGDSVVSEIPSIDFRVGGKGGSQPTVASKEE